VAARSKPCEACHCNDLAGGVRLLDETETPSRTAASKETLPPPQAIKSPRKPQNGRPSFLVMAMLSTLVIGVGAGIWHLQPKQIPEGRPIGEAGKILAFALPSAQVGEGYVIWRGGRKIYDQLKGSATAFQRIELSSNDVDIAGSSDPDLVLYSWTGGAHCCFSQILIDGRSGKKLGEFEIGNGDPTPFIPAKTHGLPRAVAINMDDVSAFKFGSYAESPMARILIVFDQGRFGLDIKRMKAVAPDTAPAFFINEPQLAEAADIGLQDFGEDEDKPASATTPVLRGDRAKAYETWMIGEETRLRATNLVAGDVASYGPMAAFLNERIYKGQATAGVASVLDAYKDEPELAHTALAYYFDIISKSRWLADLDRLNDGSLKPLIAAYDTGERTAAK
jgi:hypothetical protein